MKKANQAGSGPLVADVGGVNPMKMALLFVLLLSVATVPVHALNHPAEVVIRVLEETGDVIPNAQVLISFNQHNQGGVSIVKAGNTDTRGVYSANEDTSGYIYVRVNKEGYYESIRRLKWDEEQQRNGIFPSSGTIKDVVLRRIGIPIPMYACSLRKQLPDVGEFFGLDLVKKDWVGPYGEGQRTDLEVKIIRSYTDVQNFEATLEVRFPSEFDGLQPIKQKLFPDSAFQWPRNAPTNAYYSLLRHMERINGRVVAGGHHGDQESYFIRVRAKINSDGEIESALYGKVVGGINFGGVAAEKAAVWFRYYLNPKPNDRNLEFDPKQNLFKRLTSDEVVYDP